jgi:hypothetical protein
MGEESGSLKSVADLIPSFYYDLIARVSVGVPFLALLLWKERDSLKGLLPPDSWVAFLLLAGAGYLAGLLLTPLSLIWTVVIMPAEAIIFRKKPSLNWRRGIRNDEIAIRNKDAGLNLAKMQAEATLCQNLVSAFVVLMVADWSKTFPVLALENRGLTDRCVLFLILLACAGFQTLSYMSSQSRLYHLFIESGEEPR